MCFWQALVLFNADSWAVHWCSYIELTEKLAFWAGQEATAYLCAISGYC